MRGRITVYCVAESIDRKALELRLRERGGPALLHQYPDVLYGLYESSKVRVFGRVCAYQGPSGRGLHACTAGTLACPSPCAWPPVRPHSPAHATGRQRRAR